MTYRSIGILLYIKLLLGTKEKFWLREKLNLIVENNFDYYSRFIRLRKTFLFSFGKGFQCCVTKYNFENLC